MQCSTYCTCISSSHNTFWPMVAGGMLIPERVLKISNDVVHLICSRLSRANHFNTSHVAKQPHPMLYALGSVVVDSFCAYNSCITFLQWKLHVYKQLFVVHCILGTVIEVRWHHYQLWNTCMYVCSLQAIKLMAWQHLCAYIFLWHIQTCPHIISVYEVS